MWSYKVGKTMPPNPHIEKLRCRGDSQRIQRVPRRHAAIYEQHRLEAEVHLFCWYQAFLARHWMAWTHPVSLAPRTTSNVTHMKPRPKGCKTRTERHTRIHSRGIQPQQKWDSHVVFSWLQPIALPEGLREDPHNTHGVRSVWTRLPRLSGTFLVSKAVRYETKWRDRLDLF